jgi:hypothetical protein
LVHVAEVADIADVTFDRARPASSDPQADYGHTIITDAGVAQEKYEGTWVVSKSDDSDKSDTTKARVLSDLRGSDPGGSKFVFRAFEQFRNFTNLTNLTILTNLTRSEGIKNWIMFIGQIRRFGL